MVLEEILILIHVIYVRVQNRAAAVLDAWNEYGEAYTIDVIAHC